MPSAVLTDHPSHARARSAGVGLLLGILALCGAAPARAVYAPIPLIEQGKPLTVYLGASIYYDSNIFGGETDPVDSMVYQFAPSVAFNASLRKQTFVSAIYRLNLDYMPDRPGEQWLDSHELSARLAHSVSPESTIDLSNSYQITKNPESLLPGVGTVSGNQSLQRHQLDARFATSLTRRTGVVFKARHSAFRYDWAALARELDRDEILGGIAVAHALLPTIKSSAEYRFQSIAYRSGGEFKDKTSHFLLGGLDYAWSDRLAMSARLGAEYRQREGADTSTTPYAEIGAKRDYARGSFVSAGYGHSVEETSNVDLFTDTLVNRFFVNWQHVLTPKLIASSSVVWEIGELQGRPGVSVDRREVNLKTGVALIYRPVDTWSVSATLDVDRIDSDQPGRDLKRERVGLSAKYVF